MKTCDNCGATVKDDEKFCSQCGARIEDAVQANPESDNIRGNMEGDPAPSRAPYQPYTAQASNPFAVVALVLALAGIVLDRFILGIPSIVGLIFGIIAFNACKKEGRTGYGMSVAGIVVSIVMLAIYFIAIIWAMSAISSLIGSFGSFDLSDFGHYSYQIY